MSVLCEAISVVAPRELLKESYPGGVRRYERDCPNATFCTDAHLTRVGFTQPLDVRAFLDRLLQITGLPSLEGDVRFPTIAIVDQVIGPTRSCHWLQFDRDGYAPRAWLVGRPSGELATPVAWRRDDMLLHPLVMARFPTDLV